MRLILGFQVKCRLEEKQMEGQRKRMILGKLGLDGHDNGLRIVAKWLVNAGYEVIYAGLYNSPQRLVQMAIEENVDAVGISFLGCEHLYYTERLLGELKKGDMGHVRVILGGVIPPDDARELKTMGIAAVFTPGTPKQEILKTVEALLN
jgi:methylmalonyl-CoA mutase C-terminal domain/subunit